MRIICLASVSFISSLTEIEMLMPTVLRAGKYRFFFFSNEGQERRHIHVESGDNHAKFWLEPIDLVKSVGYKKRELREIREFIEDNIQLFKAVWDAHFGS